MTNQGENGRSSWIHPLARRNMVSLEMGETTPFVFGDRLYRLENWQKYLEVPELKPGDKFMEDQVRIWDVESDRVVSAPFAGHSFGIAYVHSGRVYVYATRHEADRPWRHFRYISMTHSDDLIRWAHPVTVIEAEGNEHLFNTAVCHDGNSFVLLYETDDQRWPAFTFKYCESDDLVHWRRIPGALYGREKYVGGPALYFEGGWFYTLYLQDLNGYSGGTWETRVTRSRDLQHWEDAPVERPFLAPDKNRVVTCNRAGQQVRIREINASDAEICYWHGKTMVYFNGGDQQTCGDVQQAEFNGTPRQLLESFFAEPKMILPSARQLAFQERQFGAFIHFGLATWFDGPATAVFSKSIREPYAFNLDQWGAMVAQPPPTIFNPHELNAAQWMAAAKAMGARHVVLTAKHHSGFCLWPTATTEYCVRNCPWRGGKGDVLREFADAARQAGLGVGVYLSAGDVNQDCFSTPEPRGKRRQIGDAARYFKVFEAQLREILKDYGELCAIWFDGALDPFGPDVLRHDGAPVGKEYWESLIAMARGSQPNAVIMGGVNPDLRWAGNEDGLAPYPLSNVVEPGQEEANWVNPGTVGWVVPEADVPPRSAWFWSPGSDDKLFSLEHLRDIYNRSIGHGANLLINMTPDRRGLIPEAEVRRLTELGDDIRRRFCQPLAETASAGRWSEGMTLELEWEKPAIVSAIILEEDLRFGQRIRCHRIEAESASGWQTAAEGLSIGRQRIATFAPVVTRRVRLRVLETDPLPKIRRFAAFGNHP